MAAPWTSNTPFQLSAGAILYQCERLLESLATFTTPQYGHEAVGLAELFRIVADHIRERLRHINQSSISVSDEQFARRMARIIFRLHDWQQFLENSAPHQSPASIQSAISQLIAEHFCPAVGCQPAEVLALVRPQWNYNLTFFHLQQDLEPVTQVLQMGAVPQLPPYDYFASRWNLNGASVPRHYTVLSFASLDRDDAILYPLLAHEVGHFIDFSVPGTLHDSGQMASFLPTTAEVVALFGGQGAANAIALKHKELTEFTKSCFAEITADLLAVRMLGFSFFIALSEFLKTIARLPGARVSNGYPGLALRLQLVYEELQDSSLNIVHEMEILAQSTSDPGLQRACDYLAAWKNQPHQVNMVAAQQNNPSTEEEYVLQKIALALPSLRAAVRSTISHAKAARIEPTLPERIELLRRGAPPFLPEEKGNSFASILAAAWMFQLVEGEDREAAAPIDARPGLYGTTCALVMKAIELLGSHSHIERPAKAARTVDNENGVGVLGGPSITSRCAGLASAPSITLVPFVKECVDASSVDLHLGHWFREWKRAALGSFDLSIRSERQRIRRQAQTEVFAGYSGSYILHPGELALGVSLEFLRLPLDIMAYVEGRSGLGRAGLIVATASPIAAGFGGCVVFELYNAGTVPLVLRPGMSIAQLVFHSLARPLPDDWAYAGTYQAQMRP